MGNVQLEGVQFLNGGQKMEKALLQFLNIVVNVSDSFVKKSSFQNCLTHCVSM